MRERPRKQIQSSETPEDLAARAGGDPCCKKRGGRAVDAPLPPPAISCNVPSGSAPPGSRASTAATPKGNDGVARRCWPSICRTWARRDSRADGGHTGGVDLSGRMKHVLYLFLSTARDKSTSPTPMAVSRKSKHAWIKINTPDPPPLGEPTAATVPNGDDRGQCRLSWPFAGPLPRCASSPLRRRPRASLLSNGP